ncbi:hypothetical protein F7725_016285 [Dissostichus mawsoni]|uniref:Uncharacterized protein n=1 Tax=Dissostichus mawsoni TaxID=36200 RepID=A0A7J5Z175_DISMA|nr:hypothetical protein F7725_016285 [Dissostichus mawsoni]
MSLCASMALCIFSTIQTGTENGFNSSYLDGGLWPRLLHLRLWKQLFGLSVPAGLSDQLIRLHLLADVLLHVLRRFMRCVVLAWLAAVVTGLCSSCSPSSSSPSRPPSLRCAPITRSSGARLTGANSGFRYKAPLPAVYRLVTLALG